MSDRTTDPLTKECSDCNSFGRQWRSGATDEGGGYWEKCPTCDGTGSRELNTDELLVFIAGHPKVYSTDLVSPYPGSKRWQATAEFREAKHVSKQGPTPHSALLALARAIAGEGKK